MSVLGLALLGALVAADSMQWTDKDSGAVFDWTGLQRPTQ